MYDKGYQDGRDGKAYDPDHEGDREYVTGHAVGADDRIDALAVDDDVNQAAQDFVDGYHRGEAGDDFQIALLESEAYRAGFRDGESMSGGAS